MRTSKFPNFSKGGSFLFDPRCHCVDVAGYLLWGIRARQLVLFFTIRQVLDCGQAGMWYCEFKIRCLHFRINSVTIESFSYSRKRLKYIYFHPDGCAPMVAHGGTYLKQYLKHERGIVEKRFKDLISFFLDEGLVFRT